MLMTVLPHNDLPCLPLHPHVMILCHHLQSSIRSSIPSSRSLSRLYHPLSLQHLLCLHHARDELLYLLLSLGGLPGRLSHRGSGGKCARLLLLPLHLFLLLSLLPPLSLFLLLTLTLLPSHLHQLLLLSLHHSLHSGNSESLLSTCLTVMMS